MVFTPGQSSVWVRPWFPALEERWRTSSWRPASLSSPLRGSQGTNVLIAAHDLAVDAFVDEVLHLEDGRLVELQGG